MINHIAKGTHSVTGHPNVSRTEGFLVRGTFSAKTEKVPGRTGWVITPGIQTIKQSKGGWMCEEGGSVWRVGAMGKWATYASCHLLGLQMRA